MVDDELVSVEAAEVNQPVIVTAGQEGSGNHYQVRGFLRSKTMKYEDQRCWLVEAYVMYHLIPVSNILEVRKESRRYIW